MRIIDADAMSERYHKPSIYDTTDLDEMLSYEPSVVAEQVIYCKDCKFANHGILHKVNLICNRFKTGEYTMVMKPDDYCSYGEKKE